MSGVCTIHNAFYPRDKCHLCNEKDLQDAKRWEKEKKARNKKYEKAFSAKKTPNKYRQNLKTLLQVWWRRKLYPYYERLGLTKRCWICDKPFPQGVKHRLYVPHIAHFFAKSHLYQLWCEPENSGIACYSCNCDKPEIVAAMEPKMVEVWGKERIDAMKEKAKECDFRIKTLQDRRYPTNEWFLFQIEQVKKLSL